jgi:polysaccharide deacetylase family protein (PEP-CTERM system associated)
LLELFGKANVRATFFVLGWVADRYPALVGRIASAGHEIGSHGFWHRIVYDQTPDQFRDDIRRSRAAILAAASVPVDGYRAPSFSITDRSLWALDVLVEEGFTYDSSIFPIHHDRYGMPSWPRGFQALRQSAGMLWECPGSTVRLAGVNLPVSGGGYFRLLPYAWTRWCISHLNARERQPAIFYLHPWEIDPDQPRMPCSRLTHVRHYRNLEDTEARLRRLLSEFAFAPLREVLPVRPSGPSRDPG